ncbi:MAG: dTDP-4-dehydrorhamnose 3,5-epimerase [Candidatus Electrothrix sp. AX1]|nr:dTDP-4-dehydrorhamnose 3,5-epimerase [Candidatus Electrothrix sp. AX1]
MGDRFTFHPTDLAGCSVVRRQVLGDERGFLSRLFCTQEFAALGLNRPIAQINHTYTAQKGTVRGMHFQYPPYTETKLVTCIRGQVFDVAMDIRKGSASFLRHHAEILSADNRTALYIPDGFAHGFQTLTDDCELLYLHTAAYTPQAEAGLRFDDPRLNISWPLTVTEMSERDRHHALLNNDFTGVAVS